MMKFTCIYPLLIAYSYLDPHLRIVEEKGGVKVETMANHRVAVYNLSSCCDVWSESFRQRYFHA